MRGVFMSNNADLLTYLKLVAEPCAKRKSVNLHVRRDIWNQFRRVCEAENTSASRLVEIYMEWYVAHGPVSGNGGNKDDESE